MTDRPSMLKPRVSSIPHELRRLDQWIAWELVEKPEGGWTKLPHQARRPTANASTTDPRTWASLPIVMGALGNGHALDGPGFVFSATDDFAGIDLDHCRDPETGEIDPLAQDIIAQFDTYWEISPSGTGLHGIVRGTLPGAGTRKPITWSGGSVGAVEIYDRGRFFTMTGHPVPGAADTVNACPEALAALYQQYAPAPVAPPAPTPQPATASPASAISDEELLTRARSAQNSAKFTKLWAGDTSEYPSRSEADAALCALLSFWTRDATQIDRLFRQSALARDKWDERHHGDGSTYGEGTIRRALALVQTVYTPTMLGGGLATQFPLDALPEEIRKFAETGARSLSCPVDFIAVPLLALAGAVLGDALEIALKVDWHEGSNLFVAIVGDPGSKKSPALAKALRPVERIQRRLAQEHAERQAKYESDLATWEDGKRGERGTKPVPPTFHHVITTDATVEALGPMLLASKGLALVKDELVGWVKSMDAYRNGRGADRQAYLSAWSRSAIKIDRKHAPPIFVSRPHLTVVGGVQPDLLGDLGDAAGKQDGFLDRIMWSYPEPLRDGWSETTIDTEVEQAVQQRFEWLYQKQPQVDASGEVYPHVVALSPGAKAQWLCWYETHAEVMAGEQFPSRLRGPWSKHPGQLARLALILHALTVADTGDLAEDTLLAACQLLSYFQAHTARVYRRLAQLRGDMVTRVLSLLRQHGPCTTTALHRHLGNHADGSRLRATLETLEEEGLLARDTLPAHANGTKPAVVWRLT